MRSFCLVLIYFCIATLCCSMSKCKEDMTPGPQTTVHGIVKEYETGEVFPNVELQISKQYSQGLCDCGPGYSEYDVVTTKPDGTYSLTFTPLGIGTFTLRVKTIPNNGFIYESYNSNELVLGKDNSLDFLVQKLITATVHLKNNSDQNKKNFRLELNACCYMPNNDWGFDNYAIKDIYHIKIDTSIRFQIPQLSLVTFVSRFYTGYNASGLADTLSFKKSFNSGKNDTTISITNP
jgi:hypothetical protein